MSYDCEFPISIVPPCKMQNVIITIMYSVYVCMKVSGASLLAIKWTAQHFTNIHSSKLHSRSMRHFTHRAAGLQLA